MKIEVNVGNRYITLISETENDLFLLGKICVILKTPTWNTVNSKKAVDIQFGDLIKALAREE